MQAASKKTGSVLYFEPLRQELNDCFGALKDVTPDQVFSNRRGNEKPHANADTNDDGANGDAQSNEVTTTTSKKAKSKYIYILLLFLSQLALIIYN